MSFRARLTLSYAIFAAVLLTLVSAVLVWFELYLSTRPIAEAVDTTAARVQQVVDADSGSPDSVVIAHLMTLTIPNGVIVRVRQHRFALAPPGELPRMIGPPPDGAFTAYPVTGGPTETRSRPVVIFGAPPRDEFMAVLALRPRVVPVGTIGEALIVPDLQRVRSILGVVGWSFLVALVLTLLAAWGIGRWITDQAVAPLVAIAGELRRFARGDFTPRVVAATDRSEVGELARAYNGAAAQVASAFQERARVEQHMRTFLGEAGHEMRTPLTVISGYLDVLERGGWDDTRLRDLALPTIRLETRRLRALVERLMTLARLEGDDRSDAEIVDVVATARDAIAEVTTARGGVVRLHADGDHVVFAEPAEVYEAIVNLVDNAVKYGAGTPVDVVIETNDDRTIVRVTDRGPGIAESDRARLFERFFRGEAANGIEGSGLGLAIVARAAERSHGTVVLESHEQGATTFRLSLPPYRAPDRDRSVLVLG